MEGSVTPTITSECVITEFVGLYTGVVNKTTSNYSGKPNSLAIYSAKSDRGLFSIRSIEKTEACGYKVYATDHPNIFIYEMYNRVPVFKKPFAQSRDLDIFTYFNSKINLQESHI